MLSKTLWIQTLNTMMIRSEAPKTEVHTGFIPRTDPPKKKSRVQGESKLT